jgi:hypothetical protein
MAMSYQVFLEGTLGFVLDTDLLDTGVLGYLLTDVTDSVKSVSFRRGKSTIIDKFSAGQMTVVFNNNLREFDPNGGGKYAGAIVPRRKIVFFAGQTLSFTKQWQMFTGYVDDWNFSYDVSGDSEAIASCSDAFTLLSNQQVTLSTPPAELSSDRIRRVLNTSSVAWPDEYFANGAAFTMSNASYSGDALSYIQSVADSERGYVYVSGFGYLVFQGWNNFSYAETPLTFSDDISSGTVIPFTSLETTYGTEQLYNYVTVTGPAGTVTAQDFTSQQTYQIAAENFDVVTAGTAQMQLVADFMVNNYKNPRARVTRVGVSLDNHDLVKAFANDGVKAVLQNDIGSTISVSYTPNAIGSAIVSTGYVIGIEMTATPERCDMVFSLSGDESRAVA